MRTKFRSALTDFLDSECNNYGMSYEILEDTDDEYIPSVEVEINIDHDERSIIERFAWRTDYRSDDCLCLEVGEDNWKYVCEFDWQVKYFWMQVSPKLWGKK